MAKNLEYVIEAIRAEGRSRWMTCAHDEFVVVLDGEVEVDKIAFTGVLGGGPPAASELGKGYYLEPTVVRAKPSDRVCQEEVFGPFVSVTTFRDEEEVVAIASGTPYGLGGGLWTRDLQRAHRIAAAMRTGMVWINCYKRVNPGSPFGGVASSGYGREMGF